ncbi:hypothetical protein LTR35_008861 [Friedmanniomyces endolithicus]|uniref:Indole-diterpene biosynthesis protein PaxU n=1 Tax=Friedmanniomyces endolithicus TaxID=329885 RepID=A0AAN6FJY2_9PEZI|nr:hypothetical protein LTR35_008861 [Friedmanniomyces endolithicus]KAK0294954.1 hypothetical protein LTS00_006420 [Friedmanniomyces endolithicus]KAK0319808.1 hypothetical protein LTR82_009143 [Friedmanniomyces endolithicus]KAK0985021.1 hypothetical protein LTR54_013821 [Friedmanniomyces endolithicus]
MSSNNSPLPNFTSLSQRTALYRPPPTSTPPDPSQKAAPQTIILCAWFRALPKHISKYTTAHQHRNPSADILLLQSGVADMIFTSHATQRAHLLPAVEILRAAHAAGNRILLHVFSNGGANSAVQLAHAWREVVGTPIPVDAVVLDSCPGSPDIRLAATAVITSIPRSQQWWAVVFVWTVIMPLFISPMLVGSPNLVEWLRRGLNDGSLFAREVPRVYLYSEADRLVPSSAVEEHCAEARNAGYKASLVRFRGSAHVAHVNEDKVRYWGAVDEVMGSS